MKRATPDEEIHTATLQKNEILTISGFKKSIFLFSRKRFRQKMVFRNTSVVARGSEKGGYTPPPTVALVTSPRKNRCVYLLFPYRPRSELRCRGSCIAPFFFAKKIFFDLTHRAPLVTEESFSTLDIVGVCV